MIMPFAIGRDDGVRDDAVGQCVFGHREGVVDDLGVTRVRVFAEAAGIADAGKPLAGSGDPMIRAFDESVSVAVASGKPAVVRVDLAVDECVNAGSPRSRTSWKTPAADSDPWDRAFPN
jgi:hypothetical protein